MCTYVTFVLGLTSRVTPYLPLESLSGPWRGPSRKTNSYQKSVERVPTRDTGWVEVPGHSIVTSRKDPKEGDVRSSRVDLGDSRLGS